ncbi:hypothetical protein A6770_02725 [Nostoc minutum NIES-26]|uniref:Uncharacterized protein n=1 Tax=Nostoc minutum NIES-26 TaxID=1844469 RepID=A0A367QV67_9NOSO|nr:hypothetical protein A6770_02725 [Nostoc minutum NIES-26]
MKIVMLGSAPAVKSHISWLLNTEYGHKFYYISEFELKFSYYQSNFVTATAYFLLLFSSISNYL